jgi:hypothetical protein
MPITFIGASSTTTNSGTAVAVTPHASAAAGDIAIIGVGQRLGSGGTITAPGGWNQIGSQVNSTTALGQAVFWRKLEAGDLGSGASFGLGGTTKGVGVMTIFRGQDPTTPIIANSGQANGSSATITHPATGSYSVTPDTVPTRVIVSGIAESATISEVSSPAFTLDANASAASGGGGSNTRNRIAIQYRRENAGTSVDATAGTAAVNIGFQVIVQEDAGGGTNYTRDVADAIGLSDATNSRSFGKGLEQGVGLSDAGVLTIGLSLGDAVGLGDSADTDLVVPTDQISGTVRLNGVPVENATVYLIDTGGMVVDSTTSNASGYYLFAGLDPGTYHATVEYESGGTQYTDRAKPFLIVSP